MASEEVYIMQDTDDEWVQPTPAGIAVTEAITAVTDLDSGDIGELGEYVDIEELRAVLDSGGAEELTLTIEGHDVRIHRNGSIDVEP